MIAQLQAQLEASERERVNNENATNLFNQWQDEGKVYQAEDGSIRLTGNQPGQQHMQQ